MKALIQQRIQTGFAIALTFLLVIGAIASWSAQKSLAAFRAVEQSYSVVALLDATFLKILNVESAQRGFAISGDENFLETLQDDFAAVDKNLAEAQGLTHDNSDLTRRLAALQPLIQRKLDSITDTIQLRRGGDATGSLQRIASGEGEEMMEVIQIAISQLKSAEGAILRQYSVRSRTMSSMLQVFVAMGSLVTLGLVVFGSVPVRRDFEKRQQAEAERDRFFTLSLDLLCIANVDGYFKRINPAFKQTLGWSEEELLARPFIDFVHPDDRPSTLGEVENLRREKSVFHFTNRYECKDGSWRWLSWISTPQPGGTIFAVARDVTELRLAEEALRRSEQSLDVTLNSIGDAVLATDTEGGVTRLNPVAERLTGWLQPEAVGRPVDEVFRVINEETRQPADMPVEKVLATGETHGLANYTTAIARDGTERPISGSAAPVRDNDGCLLGVVVVFRDVTIEKEAERAIRRRERRLRSFNEELEQQVRQRTAELNGSDRALRILGKCNQAVVRVKSEQELLDEICRIIVEHGGYRMCWVGYAERDPAKTVRPVAHAGFEHGFLQQAVVTWADTERGKGPSGVAIRTRQPAVFNELAAHPELAPWRKASAERGYASVVGLPLKADSGTLGALVICAAEPNAFQDRELNLLTEVADDLAFGITTIRARTAQDEAEKALRVSEERFSSAFEYASIGMALVAPDGRWLKVNKAVGELTGYSETELLKMTFQDITHPDDLEKDLANVRRMVAGEIQTYQMEKRYFRKSGDIICVLLSVSLVRNCQAQPVYFISQIQDITKRKQAEVALQDAESRYRLLFDQSPLGVVTIDLESGLPVEFNDVAAVQLGYSREEFGGLRINDYEADETPEQIRAHIGRLQQQGWDRFETRHRTKSGEIRNVLVATRVTSIQGQSLANCVFQDITERKRGEQELRKLSRAVEQSPAAIIITDPLGRIEYVNPKFVEITGYSFADVRGQSPRILKSGEVPPVVYTELWRTITAGGEWRGELHNRRKDGSLFWEYAVISAIKDEAGRITHFMAVKEDVTERKEAQAAVRESQRQLARAEAFSHTMVTYIALDGRWLRVPPRLCQLLGFSESELLTSTLQQMMHPQDREADWTQYQRLLVSDLKSFSAEKRFLTKGGRVLWFAVSVTLVTDQAGAPVHFLTYLRDITERKESEQRIRDQARLIDLANEAILVCDSELRVQFWNRGAERLYGWSSSDMIGQDIEDRTSAKTRVHAGIPPQVMERGEWDGELTHQTKDGRTVVVSSRWTLLREVANQSYTFLIINADITEKKQMERRFLRAQRLESIGQLAGGVAHDLNNALAPILMSIEMLRMQFPNESRILGTIDGSAKHAAEMVRQLLTFAKGAEGARMSVQPTHMIKEMRGIIKGTFPKNIQLETHYGNDVPTVLGDATQLHQVFLNLCVNARDAMPHGGRLTLDAEGRDVDELYAASVPGSKPGKYVVLRVRDTGTGIAPEVLDSIFEPFFTTKDPDKGTGLGLSTVMDIVKGHGGFIQVDSQRGKGSTFAVYLPVEGKAGGKVPVAKPMTEFRGQSETVLLVDDEATVREIGRMVLERLNFKPLTAVDGTDGLVQAAEHRAGLGAVIMNLHMPHMDGLSFARTLRRMLPDIPIVAMSGLFDDETTLALHSLGVTEFVTKPFTENQLAEALQRLLVPKQGT